MAALLALGLLGAAPLFHASFPATHDGQHQIVRLMHFHRGLVDGQLPVRWAGTALYGYGYPLFVFTYRLPFWIAEPWYLWEYIPDAAWWRSDSTSNDYDEYTPATFVANGCSRDDPDLVVASGDAESRLLARRSNALSFASTVRSDDAVVQAKVASYPGWRAFVDGRPATLADRGGRVAVAVPRGDPVVSLVWRESGWRLVGDWASLLGLVYVGATAPRSRRRRPPAR